MASARGTARIAGTCYLVTHVTSVAALVLYAPVLNQSRYVLGSGADTRVLVGGWLEVVLTLAIVGTAAKDVAGLVEDRRVQHERGHGRHVGDEVARAGDAGRPSR